MDFTVGTLALTMPTSFRFIAVGSHYICLCGVAACCFMNPGWRMMFVLCLYMLNTSMEVPCVETITCHWPNDCAG